MMKYVGMITASLAVVTLAGCAGGSGSPSSWGNYKCNAVGSSGHEYMGWATSESAARNNAMDKCTANSANPDSCHVLACQNEE